MTIVGPMPCQGCSERVKVSITGRMVMVMDEWLDKPHRCRKVERTCDLPLATRGRAWDNRREEASSKRRQTARLRVAAPVEVLTHLPELRRISE